MKVITVDSVSEALAAGLWWLHVAGEEEDSRNGRVLVAPGPVCTTFRKPSQRVLADPLRDANPFFHLMEALWMLAGRNDVAFPAYFAANLAQFSDNGETLHGAYGYRWRQYFGVDQLKKLIEHMRATPNTRRAVLTMWSPDDMAWADKGKDVPCNTQVYFDGRHGKLNMTVCCRSNDVIWGAYGANVVHFSVMQEYMAAALGWELGEYRQISNNYHIYLDREDVKKLYTREAGPNPAIGVDYLEDTSPMPLVCHGETIADFDQDLAYFFNHWDLKDGSWGADRYVTQFFNDVAVPMAKAYHAYKVCNDLPAAIEEALCIDDYQWGVACTDWLERRWLNRTKKEKNNA